MTPYPSFTGSIAESLVGSLCREMAAVRERAPRLLADLRLCRDGGLCLRLRGELVGLEQRRRDLQRAVRTLEASGLRDDLALAFLRELTRRPLSGALS
jgi:hypothetical protein